jgi:cytochrome c-type biogenesis protein
MAADTTLTAAAAAGLLSFLSPCVLPLVPPYLTFIAGVTLEDFATESRAKARRDIFLASVLFVLGLGTVFTALGASASLLGQALKAHLAILTPIFVDFGGAVFILMGLHFLGLFKIDFLYREKRADIAKPVGFLGAYVMGVAFAFAWTPCIGPILAAILAVASTEETVERGAELLAVYSLGLGVPFLLAGLGIETFLDFMSGFRKHFGKVEKIVGVLLVLTGVAFLSGALQDVSFWLIKTFPGLATFG